MSSRVLLLLALVLAPSLAFAKPKITLAEARSIALARVPGKIVHEKLKTKKKKSHYNIKIAPIAANAKQHYLEKVEVDGDTGKIIKIKQVEDKSNPPPGKNKKPSDDDDD